MSTAARRPTRRPGAARQMRDAEATAVLDEAARSKAERAAARAKAEPSGGGAHALAGAVRYEWVRLWTLRSTWWLLGAAVALNGLVACAVGRAVDSGGQELDPEGVVGLLTGGSGMSTLSLTALFVGFVGVLALGHEYRHDLARTTLTALPRRGSVLAAKAVVVAAVAAVTAVLAVLAAYAVGLLVVGDAWRFSLLRVGDTPRALAGFVALVVLTALLGLALGGLLRHVPAALLVLVLLPLAVEPITDAFLESNDAGGAAAAGRFMPFTAAHQMLTVSGSTEEHAFVPLTALGGGLVFLGYVIALVGLTSVLLRARDA